MKWFERIYNDKKNLQLIVDAYEYFQAEHETARTEINDSGKLESISARLPGLTEYRWAQYQEIEAILELLNIQMRRLRGEKFRYYLENYNRSLSPRDAEKYADADQDVLDYSELINFFALIRNKFQGIIKGLEIKGFQINNITKIRAAGMEETLVNFEKQS